MSLMFTTTAILALKWKYPLPRFPLFYYHHLHFEGKRVQSKDLLIFVVTTWKFFAMLGKTYCSVLWCFNFNGCWKNRKISFFGFLKDVTSKRMGEILPKRGSAQERYIQ